MALRRRNGGNHMIWPGFVDAVTTLLMVMIFVLTVFTVMQSVLRQQITTQDNELTRLNSQIAGLADALGLERQRSAELLAESQARADRIGALTGQLGAAQSRIADFEQQVASLLADRDAARGQDQAQKHHADQQQHIGVDADPFQRVHARLRSVMPGL